MTRYVPGVLLAALFFAAPAALAGLPDTGQTVCYNGSTLVACSSANAGDGATYPRQDGRFGRDPDVAAGTAAKIGAGAAGFDYTKISNNGAEVGAGTALGASAGDWACTRDNVTGLTWEVKVNNASNLRHVNWTYTWYNSNAATNGGDAGTPDTGAGVGSDNCLNTARCDTEKYVADVNAANLCSNNDWRMPTVRELESLVHHGASNPPIDATYFPNTNAAAFHWTGTPDAQFSAFALMINFSSAGGPYSNAQSKNAGLAVRLVRGGQF